MRTTILFLTLIVAFVYSAPKSSGVQPVPSSKPSKQLMANGAIDSNKVRSLYQDGDFDQAISMLESALREKKIVDHSDSVFVFKHLGVMYAANDKTREKGKYYMLQLLTIEPTAKIMDMFASDMIYMIFKNIQEEFATTQSKYIRAEQHVAGNHAQEKQPVTGSPLREEPLEQKTPEVSHTKTYVLGGVALAVIGVGVGVYLLSDSHSEKSPPIEVK